MGRKAREGQRVTHRKTGRSGIIRSIVNGVAHVVFDDGGSHKAYAGDFSGEGKGPCLVYVAFGGLLLLTGAAAGAHALL